VDVSNIVVDIIADRAIDKVAQLEGWSRVAAFEVVVVGVMRLRYHSNPFLHHLFDEATVDERAKQMSDKTLPRFVYRVKSESILHRRSK